MDYPILWNSRPSYPALAGILVTTWLIASGLRGYFVRKKMPPGPVGLPLIGNLFQLPTALPWLRFADFAREYGPIVSFNAAGHTVIVLNDHKSAYDLLDGRSTIYSHRPRFIMAGELLCKGVMLSFISYGDLFRRMRRVTHETFGPHAAEQFQRLQEHEACRLTLELLNDPNDWDIIVKRSASSNILTATYGWPRITEEHTDLVKRIHAHTDRLSNACIPGTSMVDIFPFLNYLPLSLAKLKRDAFEWHDRESRMFERFNDGVAKQVAAGQAQYSFVSSLVETKDKHGLSDKESAWLAGIMFSAGAETTTASISNFLIAIIHHPHIMRKAQAEIDSVVGRDRLPSFADRPRLPYMRAIVKELLRWRPAGPMGIPRRAAQDDWYNGYFIPKGATVISNIWAINRDTSIYAEPEAFRPERFLGETEAVDFSPPNMHNLGHSSFGFGRRTCVGVTFASQSLFIDFCLILWAFNVEATLDENGAKVMPSLTDVVDAGVTVGPAPFQCRLVPRAVGVKVVIERALDKF